MPVTRIGPRWRAARWVRTRLLFSTDAFGLAERFYLGAMLFRRALRTLLDGWIVADPCDAGEADRIADMIGRGNAQRIYPLADRPRRA